jgi:hypothetical protein
MAESTVKSSTSEQLPADVGSLRTSPSTTRAPGTRSRAACTRLASRSTPTSLLGTTPSPAKRSSHQPVPQPASSTSPSPASASGTSSSSARSTSSRIATLPAFCALHALRLRGSRR